jgi:hypothetical protein
MKFGCKDFQSESEKLNQILQLKFQVKLSNRKFSDQISFFRRDSKTSFELNSSNLSSNIPVIKLVFIKKWRRLLKNILE